MLGVAVLGTGEALPARVVPTGEVAALCGVDEQWAVTRTGVRERRWLEEGESALDLGLAAAAAALADAGVAAGELDLVVNASGSQLQPIPDGSAFLVRGLGLQGVQAWSVHATCMSFVAAFAQVARAVHLGEARRALIVSAEHASRGLDLGQPESALLFGDGAAAVVLGPAEGDQGVEAFRMETFPAGLEDTVIRAGGSLLPPGDPRITPGDTRFDMNGLRVLGLALKTLPGFLERLRPGLSTGLPGIDRVVPHQASRPGIELTRRLGWDPEKVEVTLPETGNLIAASIPLALHRARVGGRVRRGDRVLLAGTGAGLTCAGLVLRA